MRVTKTTEIARALAGRGAVIFNDRLAGGRRSLKVWGWKRADYERCKRALEDEGLQVEMLSRNAPATYCSPARVQIRLHVSGD